MTLLVMAGSRSIPGRTGGGSGQNEAMPVSGSREKDLGCVPMVGEFSSGLTRAVVLG